MAKLAFLTMLPEFSKLFAIGQLLVPDTDVDRTKWSMSAHTVNAYFHPMQNLICFPAAILQAPFYSIKQTRSQTTAELSKYHTHLTTTVLNLTKTAISTIVMG